MASPLELLARAIARGEELLARPHLDWPLAKNWAGDTVEILENIYGRKHRKSELFQHAGGPGAVRVALRGPTDPTPYIKRRITAQLTVLQEFVRELEQAATEKAPTVFTDAARARLWHLLNDLFPPTQYDELANPVTMYQEDLEEFLRRWLDTVRLADGRDAEARLKSFVLHAADESVLNRAIEALPEAYASAHQIEAHQRDRHMPDCIRGLNGYLESIGHELRFDPATNRLTKPGLDTAPPKAVDHLPKLPELLGDLGSQLAQGAPVAVIAFDIDGLKAVNDRSGSHAAGDACIQRVVEAAGRIGAGRGRVYRVGGDEFVMVLPNTVTSEAAASAERLRKAVETSGAGDAADSPVTVSVGVASSEDAATPELLREAADNASYVAKFTGKNRVVACPVPQRLQAEADAKKAEAKGR